MAREALTSNALAALAPDEAAARLVARRADGFAVGEEQVLSEWLAKADAHRRAFASAERAWTSFDDPQGHEILDAMRAHALSPRTRAKPRWRPLAIAALAVAAGLALFFLVPGLNPSTAPNPGIEYASARGQVREVHLPDGSTMVLDADSRAVGHFNGPARAVSLERGRAYFVVRTDHAHPFAVTAQNRQVVVTGTRFDINMAASELTVTLLEGHIAIGPTNTPGASVPMMPGQRFVERDGGVTITTVGDASENAISWRGGLIRFDDQRLDEAVAVMNRYSEDQILIADPAIAAKRVSGQFRAGETQRFAETLAEMHALRSVRRSNQIELVSR